MSKRLIAVLTASVWIAACGTTGGGPQLRSQSTGQLAPCGSGCVSSQASGEAGIAPLSYSGSAVSARQKMGRVLGRMASMGYAVVVNEGDYIHATHGSGATLDDLEFVFSQSEPGVIHVRSARRSGLPDFGANRKHVDEVRNAFTVAKS